MLLAACSDDSDSDEHHFSQSEDCVAILDSCTHEVLGDLAEECHELAHENDADVCKERKQECVDYCTSSGNEGGAAGAGGAQH